MAGELPPHALVGRHMFRRRENVNWKGRRRDWTDNRLWHHACHSVDLALWLLGTEAGSVVSQVALPGGPLGIPMDLTISLRTPSGQLATLLLTEHGGQGGQGPRVPQAGRRPILVQDTELFAAVRGGREPAVCVRSGRPAMAVLQAAQDHLDARMAERERPSDRRRDTGVSRGARRPRLPRVNLSSMRWTGW